MFIQPTLNPTVLYNQYATIYEGDIMKHSIEIIVKVQLSGIFIIPMTTPRPINLLWHNLWQIHSCLC